MNVLNLKKIIIGFSLLLVIYSFDNDTAGGIQLIMSLEQQKRTVRIVNHIEDDLNIFYNLIDTSLYYTNWRNKKKRKKGIVLSEITKQQIIKQSKELNQYFDELGEAFKSVYFNYGADEHSKKYFAPLKLLNSNLENINSEFNNNLLFKIHDQKEDILYNFQHVQQFVKNAQILSSEELKKRAKEMSVWQWLFGY